MATFIELRGLFANGDLKNKIEVAVIIAAQAIMVEAANTSNHVNRLKWAKAAFANPQAKRDEMMMALLAANKDAAATAIVNASDTAIQTAVDGAVNVFADGS